MRFATSILFNMCGGIGFKLSQIPESELETYYSDSQLDSFRTTGTTVTYFWDTQPVLPIIVDNKKHLVEWGNRDATIALPKTGWAKIESIEKGFWEHLHPQFVTIPAIRGYEKGVWFDITGNGIRGIVVEKGDVKRAYMLTKQADLDYVKLTHHTRQPIEI